MYGNLNFLRAYVHVVNGCVRRDVLLGPAVELNILTRKIRSPTLALWRICIGTRCLYYVLLYKKDNNITYNMC